jgi:hypothetical protein
VAYIDLLSIRQREVDMDLEEAAGPVMLPRIFHYHATARNPAISFLKRRHVPRDLRVQRVLGGHALKIDVQRGFHLWLLDRCSAGVRARADFKLRMTCSQGSTDELKTSRSCVLLGFFVLAERMVMLGLMMMMCGGAATSAIESQNAALAARIDVQAHTVADLDRRLGQIDSAIEEAARRGKTNTALSAIEGQRRARAALADERKREVGTLAALQAERASVVAKGRQVEVESARIRYVAELVGADADCERAIRWLIALMVLCCDPLAIALTAAASARR